MTKALNIFLTMVTVVVINGCSSAAMTSSSDSFVAEGRVQWVGNVPFERMVLTTSEGNSYVLVFDEASQPSADLVTYRVRGRLYAAEFNGARQAHIEVAEIVSGR